MLKRSNLLLLFIFLHTVHILAQEDEVTEALTLYAALREQIAALQNNAAELESGIAAWQLEAAKLAQNQQFAGSYDQQVIVQLAEAQRIRAEDFARLQNSNELWRQNFRVINRTFTDMNMKEIGWIK